MMFKVKFKFPFRIDVYEYVKENQGVRTYVLISSSTPPLSIALTYKNKKRLKNRVRTLKSDESLQTLSVVFNVKSLLLMINTLWSGHSTGLHLRLKPTTTFFMLDLSKVLQGALALQPTFLSFRGEWVEIITL